MGTKVIFYILKGAHHHNNMPMGILSESYCCMTKMNETNGLAWNPYLHVAKSTSGVIIDYLLFYCQFCISNPNYKSIEKKPHKNDSSISHKHYAVVSWKQGFCFFSQAMWFYHYVSILYRCRAVSTACIQCLPQSACWLKVNRLTCNPGMPARISASATVT